MKGYANMTTIAIIGVGGIGSRHLQALAALKRPARIQIVDVSEQSIASAEKLFFEANPAPELTLEHFSSLGSLDDNLDVVIVATSSLVRRALVTDLLTTKKVKYLILEKVLFPQVEDFAAVRELITASGCQVWVNCPRRMNGVYPQLREELCGAKHLTISVTGSDWGLGCNAVHYIDLIVYLTGSAENLKISADGLDSEILEGKRKGYIEFTGCLTGSVANCDHFMLDSDKKPGIPGLVTIRTPEKLFVVKEAARKLYAFRSANGWDCEETSYQGVFQSQMTNRVVDSLLDTGDCPLTPYEESTALHIPFLQALLGFANKQTGENKTLCPIT
jgi:hypothetical protein